MLLSYDFIGQDAYFYPSTSGISNITFCEIENGIYDELKIDEDITIPLIDSKDPWYPSTRMLADFHNTLDAGNISSGNGLNIVSLNIKRRKPTELLPTIIQTGIPFQNNTTMTYVDYTCPVGEYIYSISPVASNGIEGTPIEIVTNSEFYGWYLVDKSTGSILKLNLFDSGEPIINSRQKQGRVVIETLNQYPQIYRYDLAYFEGTLTATISADENETINNKLQEVMDKFINNHKPFLLKNGIGQVYIGDITNPQIISPLNVGLNNRPYFNLSFDFTEIMTLNDYLASY